MNKRSNSSSYRIRPAGRHLLTIGEDLIKDKTAAIVELVKNSYDADSIDVKIDMSINRQGELQIIIEDHGHGMSFDDVVNKWLVPSTTSKVDKKYSPKGRRLQGRKGIGRYAAGILGNNLLLETVDQEGTETDVLLNWDDFRKSEYLDDVEIDISSHPTAHGSGTKLTIQGDRTECEYWSTERIESLITELRLLIPPNVYKDSIDDFIMTLILHNIPMGEEGECIHRIEPFPILDAYDYRIFGTVDASGDSDLSFFNQKSGEPIVPISLTSSHAHKEPTGCGNVAIDIRVFDREASSLEATRRRGASLEEGLELSRQDIRNLLDKLTGIGVYRSGFRIRPLGDPDNDWLKLDSRRVQKPSMNIGVNQVVGYIHIEDEEKSGLEEKSARDGLKDNDSYRHLINLVIQALSQLEQRRFRFRRSQEESSGTFKENLKSLQDYSSLRLSVQEALESEGASPSALKKIDKLLTKEEKGKRRFAQRVTQIVDAYRGQATLGNIIEIVLHEGRKPLSYFVNQAPNLTHYVKKIAQGKDLDSSIESSLTIADGIEKHAKIFARLFSRIEPLTARRRLPASSFKVQKELESIFAIFENQLKEKNIVYSVNVSAKCEFIGWQEDFYSIFANLIENSLFWVGQSNNPTGEISIELKSEHPFRLDYFDNGSGISSDLISEGVLFEPGYSGRNGTGLGLTIAGDAAERNHLALKAVENARGAHFVLEEKND